MKKFNKAFFVLLMILSVSAFLFTCKEPNADEQKVEYSVEFYFENAEGKYELNSKENIKQKGLVGEVPQIKLKEFNGYKLNKAKSSDLSKFKLQEEVKNNVAKLYFDRVEVKYSIEFYLQNTTLDKYDLDEQRTYTGNAKFGSTSDYQLEEIPGFVCTNANALKDFIITDKSSLIKLYFDRVKVDYTVEYYFENELDDQKTERMEGIFGAIPEFEKKTFDGYEYDQTNPNGNYGILELSLDETTNIIKMYYVGKGDTPYSVKYYFQNVEQTDYVENTEMSYSDFGRFNNALNIQVPDVPGFACSKESKDAAANFKLTNLNSNILELKYDRQMVPYAVEHWTQNKELNGYEKFKTHEAEALFGSKVTVSTYDIAGFKLVNGGDAKNFVLNSATANLLKLNYDRNVVKFTVKYNLQNADKTGYELDPSREKTGNGYYGLLPNIDSFKSEIPGFAFNKAEGVKALKNDEAQNVVTLYYDRGAASYTVEYYLQDTSLNNWTKSDKTTTGKGVIGAVPSIEAEVFDGFILNAGMSDEKEKFILKTGADNVLKLYFDRRTDIAFSVEYYLQNVALNGYDKNSFVANGKGTFGLEPVVSKKAFEGFDFEKMENKALAVSGNTIKLYYTRKQVSYTVDYQTQNVTLNGYEKAAQSVTGKAAFGTVPTVKVKAFTGFDCTNAQDVDTFTLGMGENHLVLKYDRHSYNYTVEYYLNSVLQTEKTVTTKAPFGTKPEIVEAQKGWKFVNSEPANYKESFVIQANDNNLLKLNYVEAKASCSVKYQLQNLKGQYVDAPTYNENIAGENGENVTVTAKKIPGFTFNEKQSSPIGDVLLDEKEVVVILKYDRNDVDYKVVTHTENEAGQYDPKEVSAKAKFEKVIEATPVVPEGFEINTNKSGDYQNFKLADPNTNTLNIYLDRKTVSYSVEYHLQNSGLNAYVKDDNKTQSGSAKFGTTPAVAPLTIDGFEIVNAADKDQFVMNMTSNVLVLKYNRAMVNYTVEYYKQNLNLDGYDKDSYNVSAKAAFGTKPNIPAKSFDGFTAKNAEAAKSFVIKSNAKDNVLKLYFDRNEVTYSVEHYQATLEGSYPGKATFTDTNKKGKFGANPTNAARTFEGFSLNSSKTVAPELTEGAVVKYYYDRKQVPYTVYYNLQNTNLNGYDKQTATTTGSAIFGSTPKFTAKTFEGFDLVNKEAASKFVLNSEKKNELTLNFNRKNDIPYTIEYYLQNASDLSKYDKQKKNGSGKGTYGVVPTNVTVGTFNGFQFEKNEASPLKIKGNVVKQYLTRALIDYTVTINEQNESLSGFDTKRTVSGQAPFGVTIENHIDRTPSEGFEFLSGKSTPLTTAIDLQPSQNKFVFSFVRKDVPYTVKYALQNTDLKGYTVDETQTVSLTGKFGTIPEFQLKKIVGFEITKASNDSLPTLSKLALDGNSYTLNYDRIQVMYNLHYFFQLNPQPVDYKEDTKLVTKNITAYFGQTPVVEVSNSLDHFDLNTTKSTNVATYKLGVNNNDINFYYDIHIYTGRVELDVVGKTNWMGMPDGYDNTGYEVYIDFESNQVERLKRPNANPSVEKIDHSVPSKLSQNWDIQFTFVNRFIKPMGMDLKGCPYFDIRVNSAKNVSFYLNYSGKHGTPNEQSKRAVTIDNSLFVKDGHNGYGHNPDVKDNAKLDKAERRTSYPYMSCDFWEMESMMKGKYRAYQPTRYFTFKTTENNYVEFWVTKIEGLYTKNQTDYGLAGEYSYRFIHAF